MGESPSCPLPLALPLPLPTQFDSRNVLLVWIRCPYPDSPQRSVVLESGRFGPGEGAGGGEGRTSAHERPRGQARYRECERRREQLPRGCRRLRRGPAGGAAEARLPEGHDEMEDRRHGGEDPDEVERRAPFRVRTEAAGAEEEDRPEDEKEVQGPPGHGARAHSQLGAIGPRVLVLAL